MRDWIFAVLVAAAGGLVALGVSSWSHGAALIAAGVLLAGWAWLVFVYGEAGVSEPAEPAVEAVVE